MRDHRNSAVPNKYLSIISSVIMQNPEATRKNTDKILNPFKLAICHIIRIIAIEANTATVKGRPIGKNHFNPDTEKSIIKSNVIIVTNRPGMRMKGFLNAFRKSVRMIHSARIEASAIGDHFNPLPITRSTIVHTAMPENAIIPVISHR